MRLLPLIALSAGLFATQAAAWDDRTPIVPAEVAVNCAAQYGIGTPLRLTYPRIVHAVTVRVLPGFAVTEEDSRRINACIAHYTGLKRGEATEVVTAGGVELRLRRSTCPAVMRGGSSYCIKDPWY
ncbi:hypothetical protein P1J78_16155 [Psychromarinibacter sp. C21-152]|uniref:Uncharacterized protein n=1 Tax=Psychromarinibacter sediminicola TaxID=3033385 RepID=A0AAE3TAR5_9RHOB|nr:hypothetical protein [Psychromarinibacter sediminicola]MDF0602274.1 hypothetical protein [Psychromarinibacter sediminicola]